MKLSGQNLSFKRRDLESSRNTNNSNNINSKTRSVESINSSHPSFSLKNNSNKSVSFKGLTSYLYKVTPEYKDYKELLKIASNDIDGVGQKLLENIKKHPKAASKILINEEAGTIAFQEKKFLKLLFDSATFPVREMPIMIKDFGVKMLAKVKIIKQPEKYLSPPNIDEQVNMLKGIVDKTNSLVGKHLVDNPDKVLGDLINSDVNPKDISDGLFKTANRYFDPTIGNYNTVHERSLNRIVSGLIPAAFLANDAYNLSVLCGDKKEDSIKEKDARYKQEVTRILTNSYLSLITLGSLTKYVNASPLFSAAMTALTVLFTETSSRLSSGKPITFISKEKAKEINKKRAEKDASSGKADNSAPVNTAIPEAAAKPLVSTPVGTDKNKTSFGEKTEQAPKEGDKKVGADKKSIITFDTLLKAVGGIIVGGFAMGFLRNSSKINTEMKVPIDKAFKALNDFWQKKIYTKLVKKDFELDANDFKDVIETLEKAGHGKLAAKYKEIASAKAVDGVIKFELKEKANNLIHSVSKNDEVNEFLKVDNKLKPIVDLAVEPFKFVWATIKLPYKITKAIINIPAGNFRVKESKFIDAQNLIDSVTASKDEIEKAKKLLDATDSQKAFADAFELFFTRASKKLHEPVIKFVDQFEDGKISPNVFVDVVKKYAVNQPNDRGVEAIHENLKKLKFDDKFTKRDFVKFLKDSGFFTEAKKSAGSNEEILATSIEKVLPKVKALQAKKIDEAEFNEFVNKSIMNSFNKTSSSKFSNADLGAITKIAASSVTSTFLVADNYNMVMLKSDGENKEEAWLRAKERIVQRISALFYQTMFMKWFNQTFCNQYHSSLAGMSTVVAANSVTTEVFTRKSIGMPLGPKSYDELVDIDTKNLTRDDFLGKYFRFMSLLTGKKPLAKKAPAEKVVKSTERIAAFNKQNPGSPTTDLLAIYGAKN